MLDPTSKPRGLQTLRRMVDRVNENSADMYDQLMAEQGITTSRAFWKARALEAEEKLAALARTEDRQEKEGRGAWPAGCIKRSSCARNGACMYGHNGSCQHEVRDIRAEVAALSRTEDGGRNDG